MKFNRNDIWGAAGLLLMLAIVVNIVVHFGETWRLNSYGLPDAMLSADGTTYANGAPISALDRWLIESDLEGLPTIIVIAAALFVAIDLARVNRKLNKAARNVEEGHREYLQARRDLDRTFGPGAADRLEEELLRQGVLDPPSKTAARRRS